ncbi:MAG: glycogen/starch synthase, partial [Gemmatimonadetes bacterium]|nr:glycogen/starch synthase [Gemmatimonadota bacterium]
MPLPFFRFPGVLAPDPSRRRRTTGIMAIRSHEIDTRDCTMRILQVASEAVPWAKTGGLADVV